MGRYGIFVLNACMRACVRASVKADILFYYFYHMRGWDWMRYLSVSVWIECEVCEMGGIGL